MAFSSNLTDVVGFKAALFDLDGVILDTERQYSRIWGRVGQMFHPDVPDFATRIKGTTLVNIFGTWFPDNEELQARVCQMLDEFEATEMTYDFIPGVQDYLANLAQQGVKLAVVTSSNQRKMAAVRSAHPQFDSLFHTIVTSQDVFHSKPHPECFLLGAQRLGVPPEQCVVFEDSLHGLHAGIAAGMRVVAVAGTYSRQVIEQEVGNHIVALVDDFVL